MTDQLSAAAAAGYATLHDPAVAVDPAAARMLARDDRAVGLTIAGDVLLALTDEVPTPARFAELEAASGLAITVMVTTPEILTHVRQRATSVLPGQPSLILGGVLSEAESCGASDVLLACGRRPALRVHGGTRTLEVFPHLAPEDVDEAVRWFAGPNGATRAVPAGTSRWRLRAATSGGTPVVTLRRLPAAPVRAEDLGLPTALVQAAAATHGLMLIASPAGGGRTTTAAGVIDRINATRPVHVVCVADPVEYTHRPRSAVITTLGVGTDVPSPAEGIRTATDIGADVVELDIRDAATARAAVDAAVAGHLVVATVAAVSAENALRHLIALLPDAERAWALEAVASTLRVVAAQQLLTTTAGATAAVFEVLSVTDAVRQELRAGRLGMLAAMLEDGSSEATASMDRALALQVAAGRVHQATARAAARSASLFDQHLAHTASQSGARALPSSSGGASLTTSRPDPRPVGTAASVTPAPPAEPARRRAPAAATTPATAPPATQGADAPRRATLRRRGQ